MKSVKHFRVTSSGQFIVAWAFQSEEVVGIRKFLRLVREHSDAPIYTEV